MRWTQEQVDALQARQKHRPRPNTALISEAAERKRLAREGAEIKTK